ncbi:MAG: septal ring lytic transglycosylase RlpA family protein [Clostridia bacterium]|nr:septal ring lytic transglycosylase RlpA family protein [Clostridia bacterium]
MFLFLAIPHVILAEDTAPQDTFIDRFTVTIDGQVNVFLQQALLAGDEVYFPLRSILNAFGAEIAWDQTTSAALILTEEKDYLLNLNLSDLTAALSNEQVFTLKMNDSRTYIPVRLLAAILNSNISWDEPTATLTALEIPGEATVFKNLPAAPAYKVIDTFTGVASWYGGKFHGRKTNCGEIFDENDLTAAHRTLPFNTFVRVTFLETNKSTIVRINDRGPHVAGRVLDLSKAAAAAIGLKAHGLGTIRAEVLEYYEENS